MVNGAARAAKVLGHFFGGHEDTGLHLRGCGLLVDGSVLFTPPGPYFVQSKAELLAALGSRRPTLIHSKLVEPTQIHI